MVKLKCGCLNITVHVKGELASDVDGKKFVSDRCSEEFFSSSLVEVELGVGGITKELAVLVRKQRIEDWDVYACLNCGIKGYALHAIKGFNRVLVSKELISDNEEIEKLFSHEHFSSAFKIILKDEEKDNVAGEPDTPVTLGHDSLAKSMSSVQELLKRYLKAEEAGMEERIRIYTEQQRSAFISLQKEAFKHKMSVQRVLATIEQKSLTDSISEAMHTDGNQWTGRQHVAVNNSPSIFKSLNGSSHQGTRTPVSARPVHITQVPANQQQRQQHRSGQKTNHSRLIHAADGNDSSEADILFDIEGFSTDDCEPFFESDPEDESSDTSSQAEENMMMNNIRHTSTSSHLSSQVLYSASLPISMPTITRTAHSWEEEEEKERQKIQAPTRPEKIAESMKALALSVQDSTQHLFGDLPRSRTNTYAHSHRY